jgi:hypothetical protein
MISAIMASCSRFFGLFSNSVIVVLVHFFTLVFYNWVKRLPSYNRHSVPRIISDFVISPSETTNFDNLVPAFADMTQVQI